jgi:hypothetical protein
LFISCEGKSFTSDEEADKLDLLLADVLEEEANIGTIDEDTSFLT